MSAIGNCPWCGGEGKAPDILGFFNVQCQQCGACGPISPREEPAIAAWNRLATPGQGEVRGRVRWGNGKAYLGAFYCGQVVPFTGGLWSVYDAQKRHPTDYPTEAAARAALETAVREAIKDE